MALDSLHGLFIDELKDLYSAETQLLKALPRMAKAATHPNLKAAFTAHLEQTRGQVARLDEVFAALGASPKGKKCAAMEGLITEAKELLEEDSDPQVLDAALIAAAQRVEHYEMAGYGCVRTYAKLLGHADAQALLQQTLDEETATDRMLTELAESVINVEAMDGDEAEEEDEEPQPAPRGSKAPAKKATARPAMNEEEATDDADEPSEDADEEPPAKPPAKKAKARR